MGIGKATPSLIGVNNLHEAVFVDGFLILAVEIACLIMPPERSLGQIANSVQKRGLVINFELACLKHLARLQLIQLAPDKAA